MDFEVKDSGVRQEFPTGAKRDTQDDKPRPDLISPFAIMRLGEHLRKGMLKYGERNWERGMPYSRFIASAIRHITAYQIGRRDEDHLSAAVFNLFAIVHFEETGRTELDDLPKYGVK